MYDVPENNINFRVGKWLPSDQKILKEWIEMMMRRSQQNTIPLLPVMKEFQELIESDAEIYMLFNQMFTEVPNKPPYNKDPLAEPQVRDYMQMLYLINTILTTPPAYNNYGLVGFPINAILDWSMGTEAGFAAFLNKKVNRMFKKVLNAWGTYLTSAESASALNENPETGWFGDHAILAIVHAMPEYRGIEMTPGKARGVFSYAFECDPSAIHYGYKSWDDFFTRRFNPGIRNVASPENDNIIVNACEAAPFNIAKGVNYSDQFWIKGQPYSIRHMMQNDDFTEQFVGGTIYQAFLSAKSYHRWNSPVSGKVIKTKIIEGTYYSEIPAEGFYNPLHPDPSSPDKPDDSAPNNSQGYLSEVATRGLIFIEADNPAIGLMCFMAIGMAEVSTCDIQVYEGQHLKKGDNLGTFHFGGSTHCLIFRPDVKLEFDLHGQKLDPDPVKNINTYNIAVNSVIAKVL